MIENFWANAAYSVIPTILVGLIFWFVMRSIIRADRTERKVYSEIEAEERARFEAESASTGVDGGGGGGGGVGVGAGGGVGQVDSASHREA